MDITNFHNLKTFDKEKFKKLHYQEMVEEFKCRYKVNQVPVLCFIMLSMLTLLILYITLYEIQFVQIIH